MSSSIKTQILNNVVTTLQGVTAANGYNRTIRSVTREAKALMEAQRDMVFLGLAREDKENRSLQVTHSTLTVMLTCIVEDGSDAATAAQDIATDITKALKVDETRGSLAVSTNVTSVEELVMEDLEPMSGCMVEVEIEYRHSLGDPYTAA